MIYYWLIVPKAHMHARGSSEPMERVGPRFVNQMKLPVSETEQELLPALRPPETVFPGAVL